MSLLLLGCVGSLYDVRLVSRIEIEMPLLTSSDSVVSCLGESIGIEETSQGTSFIKQLFFS